MTNAQINYELKNIIAKYDSDDASNKIVTFLGLNAPDGGGYDQLLNLAVSSEKPGEYDEPERLTYYNTLKEAIENLE